MLAVSAEELLRVTYSVRKTEVYYRESILRVLIRLLLVTFSQRYEKGNVTPFSIQPFSVAYAQCD